MAGMSKNAGSAAALEGLVAPAAGKDPGRIVELLRLGGMPGFPPSAEDPADGSSSQAAFDEVAGEPATSWWRNSMAPWSGSAN
jgi:hypothetical protein